MSQYDGEAEEFANRIGGGHEPRWYDIDPNAHAGSVSHGHARGQPDPMADIERRLAEIGEEEETAGESR